jgi:uncharacterized protein (TIGR00725 family)
MRIVVFKSCYLMLLWMVRRPQISVIGYDKRLCTKVAYDAAYRVGAEIAKKGAVVINGGLGGVMEAADRGATEQGGLSVGIVPSDELSQANEYAAIVIATGVGLARNFIVAHSGDAVIIVGGGAGTLTEAAAAYQQKKQIIAVKGTGGVADEWAGKYLDGRRTIKIHGASGPVEAVRLALKEIEKERRIAPSRH